MLTVSPTLIVAVATGGAVGAVLRLLVQQYSASVLGLGFPWGTLIVNVLGCGLIGLVASYWSHSGVALSPEIRAGLTVGLLGALTTFSAFSLDSLTLYQSGEVLRASMNVLANVILCLIAATLGTLLGIRLAG